MEIELKRLISNIDDEINIDTTYSFSKEELSSTEIMELNNVSIKGDITKDSMDELIINLDVKGVMVLPCSITLEPVNYPFEINIDGNIEEMLEEMDEKSRKIENTIDILPIIWENILMEIPSKVVSPDAKDVKLKGNGWRFITGDEKEDNPELEKLKELL